MKKILGKNIKSLRIKKKISQKYLSEKAGITIRHLLRIEKGEVDPGVSLIAKIAKLLKVGVDDLLK
jgi:transcriptional regulator with XRE-family HTH domain